MEADAVAILYARGRRMRGEIDFGPEGDLLDLGIRLAGLKIKIS